METTQITITKVTEVKENVNIPLPHYTRNGHIFFKVYGSGQWDAIKVINGVSEHSPEISKSHVQSCLKDTVLSNEYEFNEAYNNALTILNNLKTK
jgi:hypothetical protein